MTITKIDLQTFSDGSSLTQWLVRNGAPALPSECRYRLLINDVRQPKTPLVTAQIYRDKDLLSEYTEVTRVSVAMAAVAAALYAYEGLPQ